MQKIENSFNVPFLGLRTHTIIFIVFMLTRFCTTRLLPSDVSFWQMSERLSHESRTTGKYMNPLTKKEGVEERGMHCRG